MKYIGKAISKIDSAALLSGKPVYTDDIASSDALIVKLLRSPHPFAKIIDIDTSRAEVLEGVELVLTYRDVPQKRFTLAGQSYPEPSPYDRLILDRTVRYIGDEVAIVAAVDENIAKRALALIKVNYQVLEPVLDYEQAEGHSSIIHDEDDYFCHLPQAVIKANVKRNVVAQIDDQFGEDFESVYQEQAIQLDHTFYTQAQAQAMMETFRSYTYVDHWGRLTVVSSTQVPFHIKRQLAHALEISPAKVRVIKPRVGGGFGAKQTSVSEIFPAIVTLKTGKPAKIVYTRKESFSASNSRHAMRLRVRLGATKAGDITCIHVDALSDQGAYGTHAFTTLRLAGEKTMPLYSKLQAARFTGKVVYTNKMKGGAFRGYGATQGTFAVETVVNILADQLNCDPVDLRLRNLVAPGDTTLAYNKTIDSSTLRQCLETGKAMIGWDDLARSQTLENGKIRTRGMAVTMQGSGIANIDTSTVQIKLNESGDLTLLMSPTDIGTGTDTVLVQMAAEVMEVPMEQIIPVVADTDITPYDPGSYASSGVYVTGNAVVRACKDLKQKMLQTAAEKLDIDTDQLSISGGHILVDNQNRGMSYRGLGESLSVGPQAHQLIGTASFGGKTSPPPYMAGFCVTDIDPQTGKVEVVDYVGVVDCGTVINRNLAQVQVEGGIVQGIGFALYERAGYLPTGHIINNSFMQYNIPTRSDIGCIRVAFEESYEPSGPFGAKSIGEVVINTPAPAINAAVAQATKQYFNKLPIDSESVYNQLANQVNQSI